MNTRTMIGAALVLALLSGACSKKTAPADDATQAPPATVDPATAQTGDGVQLTPTQDDAAESTFAMEIYWGWPVPLPDDPSAVQDGLERLAGRCRDGTGNR